MTWVPPGGSAAAGGSTMIGGGVGVSSGVGFAPGVSLGSGPAPGVWPGAGEAAAGLGETAGAGVCAAACGIHTPAKASIATDNAKPLRRCTVVPTPHVRRRLCDLRFSMNGRSKQSLVSYFRKQDRYEVFLRALDRALPEFRMRHDVGDVEPGA